MNNIQQKILELNNKADKLENELCHLEQISDMNGYNKVQLEMDKVIEELIALGYYNASEINKALEEIKRLGYHNKE